MTTVSDEIQRILDENAGAKLTPTLIFGIHAHLSSLFGSTINGALDQAKAGEFQKGRDQGIKECEDAHRYSLTQLGEYTNSLRQQLSDAGIEPLAPTMRSLGADEPTDLEARDVPA